MATGIFSWKNKNRGVISITYGFGFATFLVGREDLLLFLGNLLSISLIKLVLYDTDKTIPIIGC